jgi:hypothetical protein
MKNKKVKNMELEIKMMSERIKEIVELYGSTKVGKWTKQKPQVLTNFKSGDEKWTYDKIIRIYNIIIEKLEKE